VGTKLFASSLLIFLGPKCDFQHFPRDASLIRNWFIYNYAIFWTVSMLFVRLIYSLWKTTVLPHCLHSIHRANAWTHTNVHARRLRVTAAILSLYCRVVKSALSLTSHGGMRRCFVASDTCVSSLAASSHLRSL